jgi:hypothetical protein
MDSNTDAAKTVVRGNATCTAAEVCMNLLPTTCFLHSVFNHPHLFPTHRHYGAAAGNCRLNCEA